MTSGDASESWIGIDLGGTKIAIALIALPRGEILAQNIIPTDLTGGAHNLLAHCIRATADLLRASSTRVGGIGVGVAEVVDLSGCVTSHALLPWRGPELRDAFSALAPTLVEADVRAAAFGEAHFGAGRGYDSFAFVSVGTGISACLVQRGEPLAGTRGNALLLGSTIMPAAGETTFALENFASGPALVHRYNQEADRHAATGEDVMRALVAGDAHARAVVETAARALGMGIALYINLLDPAAVIVGGGLGSADGLYWERAVATAREFVWAENARQLPILHAVLGNRAGVVGAAALARARFTKR